MIYHLQQTSTSGSINVNPEALAKRDAGLLAELIIAGLPTSVSHALGRYSARENGLPPISEFQLNTKPTDNPTRMRLTADAECYIRDFLLVETETDGIPTIHTTNDGLIIATLCDGDTSAIVLVPDGPHYVVLTNTDSKKSTTWKHQTDRLIRVFPMQRINRLENALEALKEQSQAATSGKIPPFVDRAALQKAHKKISEYRGECSEIMQFAMQINTPIPEMTPEHLKQIA